MIQAMVGLDHHASPCEGMATGIDCVWEELRECVHVTDVASALCFAIARPGVLRHAQRAASPLPAALDMALEGALPSQPAAELKPPKSLEEIRRVRCSRQSPTIGIAIVTGVASSEGVDARPR
jgi:hypothetical protein